MSCPCRGLLSELARSCLFFLAGAVWASCLVVIACLLSILLIRLSMEVRSGGGGRYKAFWYPVPSAGAVYGGSSIELLVVLCGYWFCLFVSGPACLCSWPGRAVVFFLLFISSCLPARLAWLKCLCCPPCVVVVVPCSRSPAGWLVPSRASGAIQCIVIPSAWESHHV